MGHLHGTCLRQRQTILVIFLFKKNLVRTSVQRKTHTHARGKEGKGSGKMREEKDYVFSIVRREGALMLFFLQVLFCFARKTDTSVGKL